MLLLGISIRGMDCVSEIGIVSMLNQEMSVVEPWLETAVPKRLSRKNVTGER